MSKAGNKTVITIKKLDAEQKRLERARKRLAKMQDDYKRQVLAPTLKGLIGRYYSFDKAEGMTFDQSFRCYGKVVGIASGYIVMLSIGRKKDGSIVAETQRLIPEQEGLASWRYTEVEREEFMQAAESMWAELSQAVSFEATIVALNYFRGSDN